MDQELCHDNKARKGRGEQEAMTITCRVDDITFSNSDLDSHLILVFTWRHYKRNKIQIYLYLFGICHNEIQIFCEYSTVI